MGILTKLGLNKLTGKKEIGMIIKRFVVALVMALSLAMASYAQTVAPQVTEIESLKLENLKLKALLNAQQCSQNDQAIKQSLTQLLSELTSAHPGFQYDLEQGKFIPDEAHEPKQ